MKPKTPLDVALRQWLAEADLFEHYTICCKDAFTRWQQLSTPLKVNRRRKGTCTIRPIQPPRGLGRKTHEQLTDSQKQQPWRRAAAFVLRHGLDPEICVMVGFSGRRKPAAPGDIFMDVFAPQYMDAQVRQRTEYLTQLRSEVEYAKTEIGLLQLYQHMPGKTAWRFVLADGGNALSPLFRFCLAYSEGLRKIAKHNAIAAAYQYSRDAQGYKPVWLSWLPKEFVTEVARLRQDAEERSERYGQRF